MSIETIFLLGGFVIFVLVVINAFLIWYSYKAHKKIDELLEKGKIKDFKDIFLSQKERHQKLTDSLKTVLDRIEDMESVLQTTIQKTGIVRFNPFNQLGGNQSFTLALLDKNNNGFVISSLFVKDGNRVYTKAIKNGKSDHALSQEEIEAIKRAVNP